MFTLLLVIHFALCAFLVVLVLLQQGKGADAGAAFGGGSNTLFGASGASNILTRLTTGIAIAFMCTSIALVRLYQGGGVSFGHAAPSAGSVLDGETAAPQEGAGQNTAPAPVAPQQAPAESAPSQGAPAEAK